MLFSLRDACLRGGSWIYAGLFVLFCLAFFLPLSSKATNNLFYAGLALPTLIWLLWRPSALVALRPFSGLIVLLWLMVIMSAGNWSDVKRGLYLSLFFVSCLLLQGRKPQMQAVFTVVALVCLSILLFVSVDWLWIWAQSGLNIRYSSFLGEQINPVYFSLLITSGMVFLWLFHVSDWLERRSRLFLLAGLFVLGVLALWCASIFQSRSTLLGFALFFAGYLLYKRFILTGLILAGGLAVLLYALGGGDLLLERGLSYRPMIWQDAWQRLVNDCSLWFGCGADDYRFLGAFHHAHSGYMSMLYQGGLLGTAVFLLFAALCFWRGAGTRWLLLALIGWGSLLTTTAGILTAPRPLWIYFWLPTFMAILDGQREVVSAYFEARRSRSANCPVVID